MQQVSVGHHDVGKLLRKGSSYPGLLFLLYFCHRCHECRVADKDMTKGWGWGWRRETGEHTHRGKQVDGQVLRITWRLTRH